MPFGFKEALRGDAALWGSNDGFCMSGAESWGLVMWVSGVRARLGSSALRGCQTVAVGWIAQELCKVTGGPHTSYLGEELEEFQKERSGRGKR